MRDLSPNGPLISDTPPSSPSMNVAGKEVSSIQVAVTYTDGSTEIRGFRSMSPCTFVAPLSPPNSEDGKEEDTEPASEPDCCTTSKCIFEPQEIKTFPQASGYLNTDNIWVMTKNTDREALAIPEQDEPLCLKIAEPTMTTATNDLVQCDGAVIGSAKLTSAATGYNGKKFALIAPRPATTNMMNQVAKNKAIKDRRDRAFVCTYDNCGKTYLKSSHLKAHVRVHTGMAVGYKSLYHVSPIYF